ncbi:MAG: single-stranded DNA-binding protein [Ruminococcus sp.]|nr:single-stranded DNA-binding protein [Ruminococcus sp.]
MLNEVIIMGRLTSTPELQYTANGVPYCKFIVANENDYFKEGAERPVNFILMTAWRNTAEFISKYFVKGKLIIVKGSLRATSYVKEDKREFITNVEVARAYFAGDKKYDSAPDDSSEEEKTVNEVIEDFNLEEYEEILLGEDVPF